MNYSIQDIQGLWHHVVVFRLMVSLRHTPCFEPVGLSIPTVTLKYAHAWDIDRDVMIIFIYADNSPNVETRTDLGKSPPNALPALPTVVFLWA